MTNHEIKQAALCDPHNVKQPRKALILLQLDLRRIEAQAKQTKRTIRILEKRLEATK